MIPSLKKSGLDYLCDNFHTSLTLLCKFIYEHNLFPLPISCLQKVRKESLCEWLGPIDRNITCMFVLSSFSWEIFLCASNSIEVITVEEAKASYLANSPHKM